MMGNIFAKFKNDVPTAMKYYDQALVVNPKDNITMNNIGANLMQQEKVGEAKKYIYKALEINDKYPNTHFALGMIAEIEGNLLVAFENTINAIKCNKNKDNLFQNSIKQALDISQQIIKTDTGKKQFKEYKHKLEFDCDRIIDIVEDNEIPTAAKFEFAENYNRENHTVKYKSGYAAVEHLIMHELVHLDLATQARKQNLNQLFTSSQEHKVTFIKNIDSSLKHMQKLGYSQEITQSFALKMFDGINLQAYNTPIDLFIEHFLYNQFVELRAYQFLSLYKLLSESIKAVTHKDIVAIAPKHVLSSSKIYNMILALQFKELYGFDLITEFNATALELKQAQTFYDEFLEYRDDKQPAEEYELVQHWAEDLKLNNNFELILETDFRNRRTDIDTLLQSIENDPFDLESDISYKEKEMADFQKSAANLGVNMAVVMYMVEALQYFETLTNEEVKNIAFEIAMLGTQGFSAEKQGYKLASIKGKEFSGFHILAYYYVSWAMAIPEMLAQLQLPYDSEYEMAKSMHKPKK